MKGSLIISGIFLIFSFIAHGGQGAEWTIQNDHYYDIYIACSTDNQWFMARDLMVPKNSTITHHWPQNMTVFTWECTGYDLVTEGGISNINFEDSGEDIKLHIKSKYEYFTIEKV